MKKLIIVAFSLVALATSAFGAEKATKSMTRAYGMAGCGLGSIVVGKKGNQILAATTNGTFYNQTFGIALGTLNCVDSSTTMTASRIDHFVVANKVALANDIARGEGETLESLSSLLNCSDSAKLNSTLQSRFAQIFPRYDVAPNEITDSIMSVISTNEKLSNSCKTTS